VVVERKDLPAGGEQRFAEMRADEASAAGDERFGLAGLTHVHDRADTSLPT
jgi:hypothetical protein